MPKYEVEVVVELEADDEEAAFRATDALMQRAWDNDRRFGELGTGPRWHFTMLEGCVSDVADHLYQLPTESNSVVDSSSHDTTTEGR